MNPKEEPSRTPEQLSALLHPHRPVNESLEVVKRVLRDWGMADGGDPHSWRCSHPDRYGPCVCVDEIAADLIEALREH